MGSKATGKEEIKLLDSIGHMLFSRLRCNGNLSFMVLFDMELLFILKCNGEPIPLQAFNDPVR